MVDSTRKCGGSLVLMFMSQESQKLISGLCFLSLPQIEALKEQLEIQAIFGSGGLRLKLRQSLTAPQKNATDFEVDVGKVQKLFDSNGHEFTWNALLAWIRCKYIYGNSDRNVEQVWSLILLKLNNDSIDNSGLPLDLQVFLKNVREAFVKGRRELREVVDRTFFVNNTIAPLTLLETQMDTHLLKERALLICNCNKFASLWITLDEFPPESVKRLHASGVAVAAEIGINQDAVPYPKLENR